MTTMPWTWLTEVRFARLHDGAVLPIRATDRAVGYDLAIVGEHRMLAGETRLLPTGLALAAPLPEGCDLQIRPRSSLFIKHGLIIPNSPGTIDPDYTGEIKILVHRPYTNWLQSDGVPLHLNHGTRLAQLVFAAFHTPVPMFGEMEERAERGGFGHTGV